jgi:hypothetical protein
MKLENFKINQKFWMSGKQYVCADIGTRCVVAVEYDVGKPIHYWVTKYTKNGKIIKNLILTKRTLKDFNALFPDGLCEIVINSYDLPACEPKKTAFQKMLEKERKEKLKKTKAENTKIVNDFHKKLKKKIKK